MGGKVGDGGNFGVGLSGNEPNAAGAAEGCEAGEADARSHGSASKLSCLLQSFYNLKLPANLLLPELGLL